jgi:hypothetical protein
MAVQNFRIMRGLYVPDANFSWPIEDMWNLSGIASGDVTAYGPRGEGAGFGADVYGTGRNLVVDLSNLATSHGNDIIRSTYTPKEIGAGPWTGTPTLRIWAGMICSTSGVTNTARALVQLRLQGYDADGTSRDLITITPTKQDGSAFYTSEDEYILIDGTAVDSSMTATVRWYKLEISLVKPDGGGGAGSICIDWVGVGIPYDDDGEDSFVTWYGAQGQHSSRTSRRWLSDAAAEQPHIQVKHRGIHQAQMSLAFPYLSTADKKLLQACWMWNAGTPTDDATHSQSVFHANRGTSQPVLVVPDRETSKRAFYADFAAEPNFVQATGAPNAAYWPETGAIWSTNCTFRERL